jgi:hypothetical protein
MVIGIYIQICGIKAKNPRVRTYPFFEDIISYPYPGTKKGYYILTLYYYGKKMICIYILYPFFASIVTVYEQRKARPGSTSAHKSSTFYRIELKPDLSVPQQENGKLWQKWQKQQY